MTNTIINGFFTILGAIIGLLGSLLTYWILDKREKRNKLIFYYKRLSQEEKLDASEIADLYTLLYLFSKKEQCLKGEYNVGEVTKGDLKNAIKKYI